MGFTDDVKRFVDKTEQRSSAIFKTAAFKVIEDAQKPTAKGGRMRVDTGLLRNSLNVALNSGGSSAGPEAYSIAYGAKIGDMITVFWTAEYAAAREFGARGQSPDYFVRGALAKWEQFVKEATIEYS